MFGFGFWGGGGGGAIPPPNASETVRGIVEIVTTPEILAGVDDERAVTAKKLTDLLATVGKYGRCFFVSNEGNDSTGGVGKILRPYQNPQTVLGLASNNDTIIIFEGTYSGNLTITNKGVRIICIGRVTLTGTILYDLPAFANFTNSFSGEQTTVNGRFQLYAVQQGQPVRINIHTINTSSGFVLQNTFENRGAWIVKNTIINNLTGYIANSFHHSTILKECTLNAIGLQDSLSIFDGRVEDCTANITGVFCAIRQDYASPAKVIKNTDINVTGSPACVFDGSFSALAENYDFKLQGVKVKGTAGLLFRGHISTRSLSVDMRGCDFGEFTATTGFFSVLDNLISYAVWTVFIDKTLIKAGQKIFAVGSLRPPKLQNVSINVTDTKGNTLYFLETNEVIEPQNVVAEDFAQSALGNVITFSSSNASGGGVSTETPEVQTWWNGSTAEARFGQSSNRITPAPSSRQSISTGNFRLYPTATTFGFSATFSIASGGQIDTAIDDVLQIVGFLDSFTIALPSNGIYFRPPRVGETNFLKYVVRIAGAESVFNTTIAYDSISRRLVNISIYFDGANVLFYATDNVNLFAREISNFLALYPSLDALNMPFGAFQARNGAGVTAITRNLNVDRVVRYLKTN